VARERFGLDEGELVGITRLAVEASFAQGALKASLLGRLDGQPDRPNL
jgi:adenosine deaminase